MHARRSEQASEVAASLGADVGPGRRWRDRGICWSTARRSEARRRRRRRCRVVRSTDERSTT